MNRLVCEILIKVCWVVFCVIKRVCKCVMVFVMFRFFSLEMVLLMCKWWFDRVLDWVFIIVFIEFILVCLVEKWFVVVWSFVMVMFCDMFCVFSEIGLCFCWLWKVSCWIDLIMFFGLFDCEMVDRLILVLDDKWIECLLLLIVVVILV